MLCRADSDKSCPGGRLGEGLCGDFNAEDAEGTEKVFKYVSEDRSFQFDRNEAESAWWKPP